MSLVTVEAAGPPVPQASAALVDAAAFRAALEAECEGEISFDDVSLALYSTDASVYQIRPLAVFVPRSRDDIVRAVRLCARFRCPLTMRGGGTSQAGQAIGEGLQIDTSKYVNRLLEVNAVERWARVEPGIVLDELNALLKPHALRFAPDISTASRATIGGMMANNSAGARSVLYGKTIDHVLEQQVVLADGSLAHFRSLSAVELEAACQSDSFEANAYRAVRRIAAANGAEVERRFPKVLRRVGGYNLDEFTSARPFNLARMMVGSEGTLGVVVEAKLNLVPLPKHKSVLAIEFSALLQALAATPVILRHKPSAVEVMDKFILDHTNQNPSLRRIRDTFIQGDPGALLCVEFYASEAAELEPRMRAVEASLRARNLGDRFFYALDAPAQARIWSLREAALGLSMAMKEDAKSLSFVEDTAVDPERLRDYIERFLEIVRKHDTVAGVYAHASVGCLHVRPVINLKTEAGVRRFEAIAGDIAGLVLEFGGALSGEHGDGLVRSPFMRKMFGPVLYEAFRDIKRAFDPHGILNPGKIVDSPPLTANLRFGAGYRTPNPPAYFDYSEYGGWGGAVEMCSGVGACRKKLEGTMCPSFMATHEEKHSTRGRANVLRLAMAGRLGESGLAGPEVSEVLDLCLECRACKSECPVSVDMARFKSEFLAAYYKTHGVPLRARVLGNVAAMAVWGSRLAPLSNWTVRSRPLRWLNEAVFGIDSRRIPPAWTSRTLRRRLPQLSNPDAWLFADTFTNYYDPEIGEAAAAVLQKIGVSCSLTPNVCCGRPMISQGLLDQARRQALQNTERLFPIAKQNQPILFCEPGCLSAVREDAPALLRGDDQRRARTVADSCMLWEQYLERQHARTLERSLRPGPAEILLHGHCHQKAMGLLAPAHSLLSRIPGTTVHDLDAGCCGMAGSFGYTKDHYAVSRAIGERKLLPAARSTNENRLLVACGVSCRHQVQDFASVAALHPAILLGRLLQ